MSRCLLASLALVALPSSLLSQGDPVRLRLDSGEAEAALAVLDIRASGGEVPESLWTQLEQTEGYRRLVDREKSMNRSLSMDDMKALLTSDTLLARREALHRTLQSWQVLPIADAGARALAYLPHGTILEATVYILIKPKSNTFVFDLKGKPALMLYLDTEVSGPAFANRVAHELHHIGLGSACRQQPAYADTSAAANATRDWLSAFGEGFAMLAAAGGPSQHPHRDSPAADRERWDREMKEAAPQLKEVEAFLLDVLEGRLSDESQRTQRGMSFFGVQGPWYTVGYRMWSTVERKQGRERVIADACNLPRLLLDYNEAVKGDASAPRWSPRLTSRLSGLMKLR